MEIFQDGTFPNLEYHLFQVIWCVTAIISKIYCEKILLWKQTYLFRVLPYLYSSNMISWKYSKMRHFPTWNNTCFKCFGVLQH